MRHTELELKLGGLGLVALIGLALLFGYWHDSYLQSKGYTQVWSQVNHRYIWVNKDGKVNEDN